MLLNPLRALAALLALSAGWSLLPGATPAVVADDSCYEEDGGEDCPKHLRHGHGHGRHAMGEGISSRDLFYNYYVGPAGVANPFGANEVAGMYPSPLPVPPLVGHTHITYQPLLPHEFLYPHKHTYYSAYPGGGQVTTRVRYRTSALGHVNPVFGNRPPRPRGVDFLRDPLWR